MSCERGRRSSAFEDSSGPYPTFERSCLLPSSFFLPKTQTEGQLAPFDDTTPLVNLIAELKKKTESQLGHALTGVTVSYPSFFHEDLVDHLEHTLEELTLQRNGCHGDARSSVTARVAYRQAESNVEQSTRTLDCIHGPFGLENVVHIENSEQFLVLTAFEFYAGKKSSWTQRSFRPPTVSKKNSNSTSRSSIEHAISNEANTSSTALQEEFWATAQKCFEDYFAAQYTSQIKTIYRLVLTGSRSHDPKLLQALQIRAKSRD